MTIKKMVPRPPYQARACVLVVDRDPYMLRLMARRLEADGYRVVEVPHGHDVLERIIVETPDLVLVDIAMPELNGLDVCERMREVSTASLIIVTTLAEDHCKISSLEAGADDYITKPFNPNELLARIHAVLRRAKRHAETYQQLPSRKMIGSLTVDYDQCQVTVDGCPMKLTATEFRILAYLAQNAGRVMTPDLLLEHVWNYNCVGERNLLKVNISRLRHKIEPDPNHPSYIVTKNGLGYLMPVQPDTVTHRVVPTTVVSPVRKSG